MQWKATLNQSIISRNKHFTIIVETSSVNISIYTANPNGDSLKVSCIFSVGHNHFHRNASSTESWRFASTDSDFKFIGLEKIGLLQGV